MRKNSDSLFETLEDANLDLVAGGDGGLLGLLGLDNLNLNLLNGLDLNLLGVSKPVVEAPKFDLFGDLFGG